MKTIFAVVLFAISSASIAATIAPGGVIHFRGEIVEGACGVTTGKSTTVTCDRSSGKTTEVHTIAYQGEHHMKVPATMSYKHIGDNNYVMTINYS